MGLRKSFSNSMNRGLTAANIITNGDFSNGITGWGPIYATLSVATNELTLLANALSGRVNQAVIYSAGDLVYRSALIKATSSLVGLGRAASIFKIHSGSGNYERLSTINLGDATTYTSIIDGRSSGWDNVYAKEITTINLTALFGAGNEPTIAECDRIFANWFDGTTGLLQNLSPNSPLRN